MITVEFTACGQSFVHQKALAEGILSTDKMLHVAY